MKPSKETRPDRFLRRYEAVLALHQELAARGTASPHPGPAQISVQRFEQQFAGHSFRVEPGVFAPHASSAQVVDVAVALTTNTQRPVVVDVGTGCGALAVSYALRRPDALVLATDVTAAAVQCAQHNAAALGAANVQLRAGPLLEPVRASGVRADLLIANLPWVAPAIVAVFDLDRVAGWRGPRSSIAGSGRDGLDLVRALLRDARTILAPGAHVIAGMDDWQVPIILEEFAADYDLHLPAIPYFLILRLRARA